MNVSLLAGNTSEALCNSHSKASASGIGVLLSEPPYTLPAPVERVQYGFRLAMALFTAAQFSLARDRP